MGAHNSKEHTNLSLSTNDNDNHTWETSIKRRSSTISKTMTYYGWQEINRCSHTEWLNEVAGKFDSFFSNNYIYRCLL